MIRTRPVSSYWGALIAIGASIIIAVVIVVAIGENPGQILVAFFAGPFQNRYAFGNLIDSSAYLVLAGIAVSIAFRAGTFNLGGEGQAYIGSLIGAMVCLAIPQWGKIGSAVAILAAAVGAGLIAGISGYVRERWSVDELITSFLISAAIVPIVDYAVSGPLRDDAGYILATRSIDISMRMARILPPSRLSLVFLFSLVSVAVWYIYLYKSFWGYEHRLSGLNRDFARYGGIDVAKFAIYSMAASGAMFGAAGALYVLGARYACIQSGTAGMGWNGIAVALIARNHPLSVIPAALIYAYLEEASNSAMIQTDFSFELGSLIRAAVFLIITAKKFGTKKTRRIV